MAKASRDKGTKKTQPPSAYTKQYVHKMRKQSEALRKQWLEGSWDVKEDLLNGKNGKK
jgi:hypothetical protein